VISLRWRLALAVKALFLLAVAFGFLFLATQALLESSASLRALGAIFFAALGLFIGWAAALGLADAGLGQSRTEEGVRVLESRRRGYSMRTPSGRFVEFILWNPWGKLEPAALYRVTYGRFSGVIVERPAPVAPPPTAAGELDSGAV
jgi:hypothetical protein